jgi:lysylphosphatidylglycerol synthetase-like protein (DUF2156 family)
MIKNNHRNIPKLIVAAVISLATTILLPIKIHALSPIEQGVLAARVEGQPETIFGANGIFTTVTNFLLFIVGTLSVLMIVVGGIRYITSAGKDASVTKAKNTVLYAIIGLIVALLAYAAIDFVLNTLMPGAGGGWTNI